MGSIIENTRFPARIHCRYKNTRHSIFSDPNWPSRLSCAHFLSSHTYLCADGRMASSDSSPAHAGLSPIACCLVGNKIATKMPERLRYRDKSTARHILLFRRLMPYIFGYNTNYCVAPFIHCAACNIQIENSGKIRMDRPRLRPVFILCHARHPESADSTSQRKGWRLRDNKHPTRSHGRGTQEH